MLSEFLSKIFKIKESEDSETKKPTPPYTPKTIQDFIGVIKRTPLSVLSKKDRTRISAVMSFEDRSVADLMINKSKMVFVNSKDFLGPLMLDKLYKSGFTNFPVVDNKNHVKGVIHTEALNTLEIKKTDRAEKYMDKTVSYLHVTDSLQYVVEEIERTNSYYFLVLNQDEELAGFFTAKMLLDYLLG